MYKHIAKYVLHDAIVRHHLIKHGFNDIHDLKNKTWYFDINKRVIVSEGD